LSEKIRVKRHPPNSSVDSIDVCQSIKCKSNNFYQEIDFTFLIFKDDVPMAAAHPGFAVAAIDAASTLLANGRSPPTPIGQPEEGKRKVAFSVIDLLLESVGRGAQMGEEENV
jgi:hypothetical protein